MRIPPAFIAADAAPLYRRVSRAIENDIRQGAMKAGAALPTENQLCEVYGVSRITVRRALDELAQRGFVVRRQGVGTFVSTAEQSVKSVSLSGFIEDVVPRNRLKVLGESLEALPAEVGEMMPMLELRPLKCFSAVNHLAGGPFSCGRFFFPVELATLFTRTDLQGPAAPINLVAERSRLTIHHAAQLVEATAAGSFAARVLGIRRGTPVLRIVRAYFSDTGALMEAFDLQYHPDRYQFSATLLPRAA